jgi:hypothetical protein
MGWAGALTGMASPMFSLVSPLIITEFALEVPTYRSGLQVALLVGIGLYFWPWLADRYGRRTLLALNIAVFSFMMPVVALAPTFALFIAGLSVVNFALNGEWSLGSAHGLDGLFAPPPAARRRACRQWRPGRGRHQLLEDGFQRGEPWGIEEASIFDRLLQQADQRRLFFVGEVERRHSRFPRRGVG